MVDGEDELAVGPGGDTGCRTPRSRPRLRLKVAMLATLTRPRTTTRVVGARRLAGASAGVSLGGRLAGRCLARRRLASPSSVDSGASLSVASAGCRQLVVLAEVAGEGRGLGFGCREIGGRRRGRLGRVGLVGRRFRLGGGGLGDLGDRGIRDGPARSGRTTRCGGSAIEAATLARSGGSGMVSAIVAMRVGSSSASRRSKNVGHPASNAATVAVTRSTRASMTLRVGLDLAVERGLARGDPCLGLFADPGDLGLRPFADGGDVVVGVAAQVGGLAVEAAWISSTTVFASAEKRAMVSSREASAAVCIARLRSAMNFVGRRVAGRRSRLDHAGRLAFLADGSIAGGFIGGFAGGVLDRRACGRPIDRLVGVGPVRRPGKPEAGRGSV